ncbi:MAG: hypothetical protein HJJLKODD_00073 [Phycisphaerae bacterium]|nr:hypothetical protein [Phycisphaerae bacterium]
MSRWQKRFWLQSVVMMACLYQGTGCINLWGDAFKSATDSFFTNGIPTAIIAALSAGFGLS